MLTTKPFKRRTSAFFAPAALHLLRTASLILLLALTPLARAQTPPDCRQYMINPAPPSDPVPRIRIVEPAADSLYANLLYVTVEIEDFALGVEGNHWHLWLNGAVVREAVEPTVAVAVPPGTYALCIILGDGEHRDVGEPVGMMLTVQAPNETTPQATRAALTPVSAESAAHSEGSEPLRLALMAGGVVVASLAGWWLGARLGRRRRKASRP